MMDIVRLRTDDHPRWLELWSEYQRFYRVNLPADVTGEGHGRRLIEAVADAARTAGANSPYWLTHETNAVGRRLYDRLATNHGFIQYVYDHASP